MTRERGNITVMTIGFLIVLGMLVVVVVNSSAAFLQRRELMNLADRVALHAADGLDRNRVYSGGPDDEATLDPSDARALVSGIVPDDVTLELRATDDTVAVSLTRQVRLPLIPPGFPATATVRADASGQLHLDP